MLHVVLVCFCQVFDCFKFSLASSKFECLSFQLSTMKSVDWKLRFILLYTYIWSYMAFSVLSLNVRGLNKTIKRRQVFRWLYQQKSDVVFLHVQEPYSSAQNLKSWEAEWGSKMMGSHGTNHSRGVMVFLLLYSSQNLM